MSIKIRTSGKRAQRIFVKSNPSLARRALTLAKKNRKQLKEEELKFNDVGLTNSALSVAGSLSQFTNLAIGNTNLTRIGSKIVVRQIELSAQFKTTGATDAFVRCMLIKDTQTNGAIYTSAEVLQDSTASDNIASAKHRDTGKRFIVMREWKFSLSDATSKNMQLIRYNKKVNIPIQYQSANNDITDLVKNSLSFLAMCDVTANFPTMTHSIRIRYSDS